jgi:hypothetical protein
MIFNNGVAFEKVGSKIWIVSCTAPLHRTYTIVSAERQYLCSTYFALEHVDSENIQLKIGCGSFLYQLFSKRDLNSCLVDKIPLVLVVGVSLIISLES